MINPNKIIRLDHEEQMKYYLYRKTLNLCDSIMVGNYCLKKLKSSASPLLCVLLENEFNNYFLDNREYIDKVCYFVDYENINTIAMEYLMKVKNAIIYYIINPGMHVDLNILDESNLVYIDSHDDRYKNSADYILNFNLLNLINKFRFKEIVIISNDYGFQGIVDILNNQYHQYATLKKKRDVIATKNLPTSQIVNEVKHTLRKLKQTSLPKEKDGLKNYIKNNIYADCLDDKQVDDVIMKIRNEGVICLYGNTIHYQGVKYHGS